MNCVCVISIRDYHFESSSAAAAVILGRAANPVSKIGNLHTCYKGMGIMASNDCPIQYKKTAAVPGMSPSPTITDSPLTEPALPSSVPTPFVPNANAITLASRTPARPGFGFTTAQVPKTSIQSRTLPLLPSLLPPFPSTSVTPTDPERLYVALPDSVPSVPHPAWPLVMSVPFPFLASLSLSLLACPFLFSAFCSSLIIVSCCCPEKKGIYGMKMCQKCVDPAAYTGSAGKGGV